MKTMSPFKKSVLSIVVLSAVTGSFISWDKYQPRHETESLVEFYENRNFIDEDSSFEGLNKESKEIDFLADITEEQLIEEAELMAQEVAVIAYSPESGESYGKTFQGVLENEDFILVEESVKPEISSPNELASEIKVNNEVTEVVVDGNILFAFDSSRVADDYFPILNQTAKSMQGENLDEDKLWQVVGYADLDGNYIYNSKLAKKRANAVAEYLVNKGVDEDKLITISLGASQPINSERNNENNRLERRVEIHEYQEELALLSDQFNTNLEREIEQRKSKRQLRIQMAMVEQQLVESDLEEVQLSENQQGENQVSDTVEVVEIIPEIDFQQEKLESITTVMEL